MLATHWQKSQRIGLFFQCPCLLANAFCYLQPALLEIWEARSKKQRSSGLKSPSILQFQSVAYLIARLSKNSFIDIVWITFFFLLKIISVQVQVTFLLSSEFKHIEIPVFLRIPDMKRIRVWTTRQWIRHSMRKVLKKMSWMSQITFLISFLVVCLGRDRVFDFLFTRSCTRERQAANRSCKWLSDSKLAGF